MTPVTLDPALDLPDLTVGLVESPVLPVEHDPRLWEAIQARIADLAGDLDARDIPGIAEIAALRRAYRQHGKDPTRYRGSQESLLRRVVKGTSLYRINSVVDANNLLSLETFCSAGTFDADTLVPPIVFRVGREGERYAGIGRDMLNIAGLPLLADEQGPFGSPTSDSERTRVTLDTRRVLTFVISFAGRDDMPACCDRMAELLVRHASAPAEALETAVLYAE